jgi:hypothetical protein
MPDEDCPSIPNKQNCVSLMAAAAVGAHSPLVMPTYSVKTKYGNYDDTRTKQWNFIDGAYSDSSGAATALDLYKEFETIAPEYVDLRMILITSAALQPDLNGNDNFTNVLGYGAIVQACNYVYHEDPLRPSVVRHSNDPAAPTLKPESNEDCVEHAGDPAAPLSIVEIQDQTYGLSLGWNISKTSFAVVSWILGEADGCPDRNAQQEEQDGKDKPATEENENAQLANTILYRNSCVLKMITGLIDGSLSSPVIAR